MAASGISRRRFLSTSVALAAGRTFRSCDRASAFAGSGDNSSQPVVSTRSGKVGGRYLDGVHSFKGIPYGDAVDGPYRFQPPRTEPKWNGLRDVTKYGPMAMQDLPAGARYLQVLHGIVPDPPGDLNENCLYLNVWTKTLDRSAKLPVMVWLHPGSFYSMASYSPWTDGTVLAREHDVVVVSLDHRLQIFGHLYLAHLGGAAYQDSGNVGLLDMIAGLRWVHDCIASFGGDRDNVTIFGESGGGAKVSTLMAMPHAKGLFHRAIIESSALTRAVAHEEALIVTQRALTRMRIQSADYRRLHTVPAKELLQSDWHKELFLPVVDGRSLPRHPFEPDAPTVSADVPLLLGANANESEYNDLSDTPGPEITFNNLADLLMKTDDDELRSREDAEMYIHKYLSIHPGASARSVFFGIMNNVEMYDIDIVAQRKSTLKRSNVYMYYFTWASTAFGGRYGSNHTFEIPFVFGNLGAAHQLWGDESLARLQELSNIMRTTWTTFARSGNPNSKLVSNWTPYTQENRETMLLDYVCKLQNDPRQKDRTVFEPPRAARAHGLLRS